MSIDKNVYITILCQTLSPCSNYLVAGDIYGYISIFNIERVISGELDNQVLQYRKPLYRFETKHSQVSSLASTKQFLISGCIGEIIAWDWTSLIDTANASSTQIGKMPKIAWSLQPPGKMKQDDFTAMLYDKEQDILYGACADSNIYVFALDSGKCVRTMSGHEDFIHDMSSECNLLISGGEDGLVKMWDMREKRSTQQLAPFAKEKLNRYLGKWIGAVSLYDNWAVCGGGPRASLWHLRSLQSTTIYETNDNGIHVIDYYEGNGILIGGAMRKFSQFSLSGELISSIPISSPTAYSACVQLQPKLLTISGSSPCIDVCTSYTYRDQVISLI